MKISIFIQIIIILSLLAFVIFGNLKFADYSNAKKLEFETYLMVVESKDSPFLVNLKTKLDSMKIINETSLISPQERTEKIRNKFRESFPQKVIEQLDIPGQLSISFDYPSIFEVDFLDLQRSFLLPPKSEILFDEEMYSTFKNNYYTEKNLFNYIFWGFALVSFFVLIRIRILFERMQDNYWHIMHRAGGDVSKRTKVYWQTSFLMIFVILVSLIGYLFYIHHSFNFILFEIKFIVATALYLLIVNLFAKLLMWKLKW